MDMIKDKEIVVPGQVLAKGMDFIPSSATFRDGEDIVASRIGLAQVKGRVIQVIPLTGPYMPEVGDVVIGRIVDMNYNGWEIDIGHHIKPFLTVNDVVPKFKQRSSNFDMARIFNIGDIIRVTIIKAAKNDIKLGTRDRTFGRLNNGILVKIPSVKVPRVIGKKGSMISLLKDFSGCRIFVGKNGWIWISGDSDKELMIEKAVKLIDKEAHKSGLTEKIQRLLGIPEEDIKRMKESLLEENSEESVADEIQKVESALPEEEIQEKKPKAKKTTKKGDKK
ncbi:MAG: exosome complex RNA-binding protein Rrp4 [Candidatus Nanoarchaeia archaeon]|nr:exosome complex RNA-binding protein Rrp4 [Candidatus Omnitrophota bacterium]MDD5417472.1 exosome complex RNA-binding protein Rrp4 [Candidatus Nanoarchaeia archaeon]